MQRFSPASACFTSSWTVCLVLGLIALGCSSETDGSTGSGSGGTGGSSGQGGSGGTAAGGSGGSGGSSASGGTSSGGGSGGVSGTSGVGGTPDEVLNPDLPAPSFDCRTDLQNKQCVSIRGTINGQAIDRRCVLPNSPLGFIGNPPAWVTSCEEQADGHSYIYRVDVVVQQAGVFHHVLDLANYTGVEVIAGIDGAGGDARSNSMSRGEVAGSVVRDAQTTDDIISGTFRATWGTPPVDCNPRYVDTCAPADVHGTFRVDYALKASGFP